VDVLGHDFFTGSRLAGDENGNIVHGVAVYQLHDLMELRGFADY
jgi:hypothetical protein